MFSYPEMNLVAVAVAAVVHFLLGFAWYAGMTPTGKAWAAEMNFADRDAQPGYEMLAFPVSSILAAWAVAMVIGWSGAGSLVHGLLAGLVVAAAVGGQSLAAGVASQSSTMLQAINIGYIVVGYGLVGAIIGAMG